MDPEAKITAQVPYGTYCIWKSRTIFSVLNFNPGTKKLHFSDQYRRYLTGKYIRTGISDLKGIGTFARLKNKFNIFSIILTKKISTSIQICKLPR